MYTKQNNEERKSPNDIEMTKNLFKLLESIANIRISLSSNKEKLSLLESESKHLKDTFTNIFSGKINPNLTNDKGSTLLHIAVFSNVENFVTFLVKEGADVNKKNKDGNTSLHLALSNDNIAKILLENGANPYIKNNENLCYLDLLDENKREEITHFINSLQTEQKSKDSQPSPSNSQNNDNFYGGGFGNLFLK